MENLFVVMVLVFLMVTAWMFFSKRTANTTPLSRPSKTRKTSQKSDKSEVTKWRSVRISPGLHSCNSVRNIVDQTYLATEAPALPLGQCSEKECKCRYLYLDDRRSSEDRRGILGHVARTYLNYQSDDDRRQFLRRRITDIAV